MLIKPQARALWLEPPAPGEQHHPGHPAQEVEEETHQAVQPKSTAKRNELALAGRAWRPFSRGEQLGLEIRDGRLYTGLQKLPQGITQGQARHRGNSRAWHITGTSEVLGNILGHSSCVQRHPAGIREAPALEQTLKHAVSRQPSSAAASRACSMPRLSPGPFASVILKQQWGARGKPGGSP